MSSDKQEGIDQENNIKALDADETWPAFNAFAEIVPTEDIPLWMSYLRAPSGAKFLLTGAEVSIGRAHRKAGWTPAIDLSAEEYGDTVSRRHVVLTRRGIQWSGHEVPEGTANGTYLNGQRMKPGEPFELRNRDLLRLGWVELMFHQGK